MAKKDKKRIKVLLIEDDEFLAEMYSNKFGQGGFEVITCADGKEALAMAAEKMPDIILLDILLPKLDGLAVLQNLKRRAKTKNIPVAVLTNLGKKEDIKKGLDKGADAYLIKAHFLPSEVIGKIKRLVGKK